LLEIPAINGATNIVGDSLNLALQDGTLLAANYFVILVVIG
jgi:hypothetical protein